MYNDNPLSAPRQPGFSRRVQPPTALHEAATNGDAAAVKLLLAGGANPNATTYFGFTPLHLVVREYAQRQRHYVCADRWSECARLLLEAGANPLLRCLPNTTPAGLGEGYVPPVLRDAMVVLAAQEVWKEDERTGRERTAHQSRESRTYTRTNFLLPEDCPVEEVRPGDRSPDPRAHLSTAVLDTLAKSARRVETLEERDRKSLVSEALGNQRRYAKKPNRDYQYVSGPAVPATASLAAMA
jgi:hypothetical protein